MHDEILFAEDVENEPTEEYGKWKILIVDDEPEVHAVTKLALSDFVFLDKRLEFVSAYSGAEAREIFLSQPDIAVVLLDVVMETDDAGLQVANFIRNEANNLFTRIILRTGQPGQAPERDVIVNYDINDYKSKTELTAQKLFTVVIAALRSYRDIVTIEENRKGLEKIILASKDLFSICSLEHFIEGLVQQLTSFLGGTKDAVFLTSAVAGPLPIGNSNQSEFYVFTGKGEYESTEGKPLEQVISGKELLTCQKALKEQCVVYEDEYLVAYCSGKSHRGSLLYLSGLPRKLTETDKELVEMFSENVQIAFDNVLQKKNIEDTQREIIERLGQSMEHINSEGRHIQRMVKICQLLAKKSDLDEEQIKTLTFAVPLHDIGKVKIPDSILFKTDPLDEHETAIIRNHAKFGYDLLKGSQRPQIKAAALLARDHHEYWNGKGYPRGLAGEDIHIFSRITALVDAYEVMSSKLNYKEAWPAEKVLAQIIAQRAEQFDPQLVDILQENIDEVEQIRLANPDPE